jgi:hypothetical protein
MFDVVDDFVDEAHRNGSKCWLTALRDSTAFKIGYAYGLRRLAAGSRTAVAARLRAWWANWRRRAGSSWAATVVISVMASYLSCWVASAPIAAARSIVEFTNEYPWPWRPLDLDQFLADLRSQQSIADAAHRACARPPRQFGSYRSTHRHTGHQTQLRALTGATDQDCRGGPLHTRRSAAQRMECTAAKSGQRQCVPRLGIL